MKNTTKTVGTLMYLVNSMPARSAWARGVKKYANEILFTFIRRGEFSGPIPVTLANALDGAANWKEYSYDGKALIYADDIARRLCAPNEFQRVWNLGGVALMANSSESWLDVQARALAQAWQLIEVALK